MQQDAGRSHCGRRQARVSPLHLPITFFLLFLTLFTPRGTQTHREYSKALDGDEDAEVAHAGTSFPTLFLLFLTPCFRTTKWARKCGNTREDDAPREHPRGWR